jgi:PiT family inorganic phosphate transporter
LGAAVADTIGGIVAVTPSAATEVIGAGLAAAVTWNLVTWRLGLPSSSGHALIGGLVGASVVEGGIDAVNWGGFEGWRPVGVFGTLVALAVSVPLGAVAALVAIRALRLMARRATRRWDTPIHAGEWGMSAALAFSHGANDAQKTMGVITLALFAAGAIPMPEVPFWVKVASAVTIALGTYAGGKRIIRTLGMRLVKLVPAQGFAAETAASAVLLGAAHFGFPISTTHVITTSVMGVGATERASAVKWGLSVDIFVAWIVTLPAAALMGALCALAARQIFGG